MINVVSVKFKGRGKTYFFDPGELEVPEGVQVVVETSKGLELCECVQGNHTVTDERIVPPLRQVVRIATADDLRIAELCKAREKEAFGIAEKKIAAHGLEMKLVDVECNFEGNKMLFFFTADGRVDFRELVKDLAGEFRTRIELRQIGVRDEAKMLGGIGMCGRPYCCSQFLDDFEPVSTKMAKTQSLSLNPTKISGCCGRLMCCLRYEEEAYEELVKTVPKNGAFVETVGGYGNVVQVNLLRQKVKVRLDGEDDSFRTFDADEVAAVPGGRPKPGEPLPHVLQVKPKQRPEPQELPPDDWAAPPIFAEDTAESGTQEAQGEKKSSHRRRSRGGKKPAQQESAQKPVQTPPEPKGEAPASGEKKEGSASHRRHRGGRGRGGSGKKPAEGQEPQNTQPKQPSGERQKQPSGERQKQASGERQKQPSGNQPKQTGGERQKQSSRGQAKQTPAKPQGEQSAPAAQNGEKKPGGSHHRGHRGGRGRGKPGGGAAVPPKAE